MSKDLRPGSRETDRVVVALFSLLLMSCGSANDGASNDETARRLDGRTFLSQSIDGRELVPDTQIRISFDGDQIGAHAGCNSLGAAYRVEGGRLLITDGMSTTDIGCDAPRQTQDEWLTDFLLSAPRIELDEDTLTMATADATLHLLDRSVADPDRPLLGTRWRVDTIIRGDGTSSVPDEGQVTLEFHDDGTLTAEATGCTSATINVDVDGDTIHFAEFVIDSIGCPTPWDETVELLRSGDAQYAITATRLTLRADDLGLVAAAD